MKLIFVWFHFSIGGDQFAIDDQASVELAELSLDEPDLEAVVFGDDEIRVGTDSSSAFQATEDERRCR